MLFLFNFQLCKTNITKLTQFFSDTQPQKNYNQHNQNSIYLEYDKHINKKWQEKSPFCQNIFKNRYSFKKSFYSGENQEQTLFVVLLGQFTIILWEKYGRNFWFWMFQQNILDLLNCCNNGVAVQIMILLREQCKQSLTTITKIKASIVILSWLIFSQQTNTINLISYHKKIYYKKAHYQQSQSYSIKSVRFLDPHSFKMTSKMRVIFQINTSQGSRIKHISMHPIKDWVGIINENNTFSLWNYQEKILIKSFSCNTLDDSKIVEIRDIVFYDRFCLCALYAEDGRNMRSNIIFVTNSRLIFYDYITDAIKQTSQKDLQQKNIRKVCVYSHSKICIAMSDGTFKVLDTKQSQAKGVMSIRTVKGYHVKPISWIFAYSQNYNEMPRVITASDQDGLMACWNIDMILKSPPNMEMATPSFKFQSGTKKTKQSISNQEILCLQYDPSSYKLITLNQQYIRIWSTMTGMEVKRIKNVNRYREIVFYNHFSYASESYVAHSKGSKVHVARSMEAEMVVSTEIELKNFFSGFYTNASNNPQEQAQLTHIYTIPQHPSHIFLVTSFSMAVMEVDKFYVPPFGVHHFFTTRLSTINSRDLVNKSEGGFRKNISAQEINQLKFQDEILTNSFFLSVDQQYIYFNLLQIQYSTMLHETRKHRLHTLPQSPLQKSPPEGRSTVLVNFQANQLIIFNKSLCYYQIYSAYNEHEAQDLLSQHHQIQNRIDFYSKFQMIGSGYARDVVYHQYKRMYAVVGGFDDTGKIVEYGITREKKGIFGGKTETRVGIPMPTKFAIIVYQKMGKQYKISQKSPFFSSKIYRLYNFGSFFGYSLTRQNNEIIEYISGQKGTLRQIEGILSCPEQVYTSYCESYFVLAYDKYFVVVRVQENGGMCYWRTYQFTVLHGFFWEKFFFFLTESSLYFLQLLPQQSILIKLASTSPNSTIEKILTSLQDDDLEPEPQLLPVGQQQIINIINMNVVLLSESGIPTLVDLGGFPYVVFCLGVASGVWGDEVRGLYRRASGNIRGVMKETMANYGVGVADLN